MKIRKELKYEVSYEEYQNIKQVLDYVMKKDQNSNENGEYNTKSIYFDNHYHEVENSRLTNINSLKKYRIRMYNDDDKAIFLERKSNENGFIEKRKQKMEKEDVLKILERRLQRNNGK